MTDRTELENAAKRIDRAIRDEGPRPDYHREIMVRHQKEWPVLWKAIHELLAAIKENNGNR